LSSSATVTPGTPTDALLVMVPVRLPPDWLIGAMLHAEPAGPPARLSVQSNVSPGAREI